MKQIVIQNETARTHLCDSNVQGAVLVGGKVLSKVIPHGLDRPIVERYVTKQYERIQLWQQLQKNRK